jgi:hypothetical protein
MENIMKTLLTGFIVLLVLGLAIPAFAGDVKEYSADVVDVKSGRITRQIAVAPGKMHYASFNSSGKLERFTIIRMDQNKMYLFTERTKIYAEQPFNDETITLVNLNPWDTIQTRQEQVGSETINGYKADKFRRDVKTSGTIHHSVEWVAPEFAPLSVRTEEKGVVTEMRNIKIGPPDAALFEIPKGYSRANPQVEQLLKKSNDNTNLLFNMTGTIRK